MCQFRNALYGQERNTIGAIRDSDQSAFAHFLVARVTPENVLESLICLMCSDLSEPLCDVTRQTYLMVLEGQVTSCR